MSKEDKQGYIVLAVLIFITSIIICITINSIRVSLIRYEYYKDGEFGISKECYVSDKDVPMCKIENNFVVVDNYYRK